MEKIKTKHFQYTGLDDYDRSLDDQMNEFFAAEKIMANQIVDVEYAAHSTLGINNYSALVVYKVS